MRQAVLIAARDQHGAATRDTTMRESMPAGEVEDSLLLKITVDIREGQTARWRVERAGADNDEAVYEKEVSFPFTPGKAVDYMALVAAVEPLSRGEMAEALGKAGLQGKPNPVDAKTGLPERTAKRLSELNFFSQMAVLREVHALQRTTGESPQTLAALVRAYANLGQLTKFHWNASHKAFAAHSLLYAQRLVATDSGSAWALRHRAYAAAFAGLHAAALADLKAAAEKEAAAEAQSPADKAVNAVSRTPWEPLIDALCRYDAVALQKSPAEEDLTELAALCAYLVVEDSSCESMTLTAGRKALEIVPECYVICDSMNRYTGVINRHMTTVQAPMELGERVKDRLRQFADLPASVNEELRRPRVLGTVDAFPDPAWAGGAMRASLVGSLASAGTIGRDTREPSWELVGRLLEDVTLVHVFRRLEFFHDGLGLPAESYRDQLPTAFAAVGGHPYLPLVKTAVLSPQRDVKQIASLLESSKAVDIDLSLFPLQQRVGFAGSEPSSIRTIWWNQICRHVDHTAEDLERMSNYANLSEYAHLLLDVSPHSPQAIGLLVLHDHDFARDKMKDWETDRPNQAVVMKALGLRYNQLGQFSDAERCLRRYVELSPDQWGFAQLADAYRKQKQTDKWQETLEESLKHEDFALSHANTQVKLARHFMGQKNFDKALPYANAAAQSGAGWAMVCAAECHEGLENWDLAEEMMQATAQRYADSRLDWFFWCCRTGHGHIDDARRLAMQTAPQLSLSPNYEDWDHLGIYHLLCGKSELARKTFAKAFEKSGHPYSALHAALLEDEAHNSEARDKLLVTAVDRGEKLQGSGNPPTNFIEFTKWLNNAYHQPVDAQPNVEALDEIFKAANIYDQANLGYYAGRYCHDHGRDDLARVYLEKSVATKVSKWNVTASAVLLRELTPGEKPADKAAKPPADVKSADEKEY